MESIIYEGLALTVDAIAFSFFYKLYQIKSRNIKALKEAPCLDIDNTLASKVQQNGDSIPYVVIGGTVKASSTALKSKHLPGLRGVIQELITKEQKVVWVPIMRTWNTEEEVTNRFQTCVPFALVGTGGWLQPPARVEIVEPLLAEELTLTRVQSSFTPHERTLRDLIVGWFLEQQTTGIVETEDMLTENTFLVGAGTLVLEEGSLKLKPPSLSQAAFFLSPLSLDTLLEKLRQQAKILKTISFSLAAVGIFILSCIMMKGYRAHKRKLERKRLKQRQLETRARHGPENASENFNPTCVVCLTNPVEAIVLDCGHACLCVQCSESIGSSCPMCRKRIYRIVPAYLP